MTKTPFFAVEVFFERFLGQITRRKMKIQYPDELADSQTRRSLRLGLKSGALSISGRVHGFYGLLGEGWTKIYVGNLGLVEIEPENMKSKSELVAAETTRPTIGLGSAWGRQSLRKVIFGEAHSFAQSHDSKSSGLRRKKKKRP
jgi:hypothetical protein